MVNDHTEVAAIAGVLDRLGRGERVAVVTDAGMPGISDPGERLVRAAVDAGHAVEVVPGPSAAVTALVASGLPAGRFAFEGFLPRKGSGRSARLAELAAERRTIVLYEAPHRLARTLADLAGGVRPRAPGRGRPRADQAPRGGAGAGRSPTPWRGRRPASRGELVRRARRRAGRRRRPTRRGRRGAPCSARLDAGRQRPRRRRPRGRRRSGVPKRRRLRGGDPPARSSGRR